MDAVNLRVYFAAAKRKLMGGGKTSDPYSPLPAGTFLSPSQGISANHRLLKRVLDFKKHTDDPFSWQKIAREKLVELSGYEGGKYIPEIAASAPVVQVGNAMNKKSIYLRVGECSDIPVHLIYKDPIPNPAPIFIFLAGSTSGVHVGWGEAKVPIDHQRIAFGADMLKKAAIKGYVAVGIEQAGYGERAEKHLPKMSVNRTVDAFSHLLLQGRSLMGLGATDISAVIDWLLSPNNIVNSDPNHLYIFGHSSGGTLAQYASAIDTRIQGVMASGSVGSIKETIGSRGSSGGDGIIPGILKWMDSADIMALNAPRPFVGLSGEHDHIFPYRGVCRVVEEARKLYSVLGARSAIQAIGVQGGHRYYGEESWQAWRKWVHKI